MDSLDSIWRMLSKPVVYPAANSLPSGRQHSALTAAADLSLAKLVVASLSATVSSLAEATHTRFHCRRYKHKSPLLKAENIFMLVKSQNIE